MFPFTLSLVFAAAQALLVPPSPGPYSVAVNHFELDDLHRIDGFAPESNTTRRIMASAYLPIHAKYYCKHETEPYMPALTARVFGQVGVQLGLPDGILESFKMEFCDISTVRPNRTAKTQHFPVAVFSPGAAGSRLLYGAMARSLASLGYIVFTVDHTYETQVVEFPDGSAVYAANFNATGVALLLKQLDPRVNDVSLLISQLSNKTLTSSLFANFPGTLDPRRVIVYGHSFGGATALTAAQRDSRVIGGVNLDGPTLGDVAETGFKDKPFVFVATTRNETRDFPILPYWAEAYPKIDAPKMKVAVRDTQHYIFLDVPLLLTVYKLPSGFQQGVDKVFGTLNGRRVEKATNDIVAGLLELVFHGDVERLEKVDGNRDVKVVSEDLRECD